MSEVKICGISTLADYLHCAACNVDYVGFVFFEKSPRHLSFEAARHLATEADNSLKDSMKQVPQRIALSVNADDATLEQIIQAARPDILQLHGHESPERTYHIKQTFGIPVMPVIKVTSAADIAAATVYFSIADKLLFDAAPPQDADLPGGMGAQFDWTLMQTTQIPVPWMLGGGLEARNVVRAIEQSGTPCVDVSSGVEKKRGEKSHSAISRFVQAAKFG